MAFFSAAKQVFSSSLACPLTTFNVYSHFLKEVGIFMIFQTYGYKHLSEQEHSSSWSGALVPFDMYSRHPYQELS
jgi:hypothetical protein